MTRMTRAAFLLCIILLLCTTALQAQQKDFQFWPSAGVDLDVTRKLKVMFEEEVRLKENCTQIGRQINEIGIGYKFSKSIRAAIYYRIEASWKTYDDYRWKQGFYADLALKHQAGPFAFGYRLRFQSSRIEFNNHEDRLLGKLINRHKFSLTYHIKDSPFMPFIEEELFLNSVYYQMEMVNNRTWFGITFTPGKTHEFSIKYGVDHERQVPDPLTSFIIAINYRANLKLKAPK
jgi:hypothetical protein